MANITFYDMQSRNAETKLICGSMVLQGVSDPAIIDGAGFTVVRNSTSVYSVRFDSGRIIFPSVLAAFVQFVTSPFDRIINGPSIDESGLGANAITFRVIDISGTPSLSSDLTGNAIQFAIFTRNTSVVR